MAYSREEYLEHLVRGMRSNYDIEYIREEGGLPLKVTAAYHEHNTSYLLIKSARMWEADRHEYMYIFDMPRLTKELYDSCIEEVLRRGEPLVKPDGQHMCTSLVAVFLCDEADAAAELALRKCRIKKSFQFSLQGWMEVQTDAVELGNTTVIANYPSTETARYLKGLLRGRRRSLLSTFLSQFKKQGE